MIIHFFFIIFIYHIQQHMINIIYAYHHQKTTKFDKNEEKQETRRYLDF